MTTKRKPAVAGQFYPSEASEINGLLTKITQAEDSRINKNLAKKKIIGAVLPHAGYVYSAYQAVHFFEILRLSKQKFDTVVIVNPNHTGKGKEIGIDPSDIWETPLGDIPIDKEFAESCGLPFSKEAHEFEHSAEVMLPMFKHFTNFDLKILPLSLGNQNYLNAKAIARNIYNAGKVQNKKILFIASTDFSHHVTPEEAQKNDNTALKFVLNKDGAGLIKTVKKMGITMCGYGPTASLIEFSNYINIDSKAELLRYGHSGEVSPSEKVVGYASVLFYED
jgi:AmmeMemoRadiSam system protein B